MEKNFAVHILQFTDLTASELKSESTCPKRGSRGAKPP
ncbi:MAG: hypothetical protein EZS28_004769, partial [Streblomastix strix]